MAVLGNEYTWLLPVTERASGPVSPRYLSFYTQGIQSYTDKLRSQSKCQTSYISKPDISVDIRYDCIICTAASISKDNEAWIYGYQTSQEMD